MQEELDDALMHVKGFGEGQCFTNKAAQVLTQGVIEAFDVVGGAFGVRGLMLASRQDIVVALQMIRIQ